jgi:hypothetical protein
MSRLTDKESELRHIKSECNSPKHKLLDLARRLESISPREAAKLDAIIGRLEKWQNR